MSDLTQAALILAGFTLAFLFVVYAVYRKRNPRPVTAAPRMPKLPSLAFEARLPRLSRKPEIEFEPVEIAPSRLARISKRPVYEPLEEPVEAIEAEPVAAEVREEASPFEAAEAPAAAIEPAAALEPVTEPVTEAAAPVIDERILQALATEVEAQAHGTEFAEPTHEPPAPLAVVPTGRTVRLVPQFPPRDAILRKHWLGGRPYLPAGAGWPKVDGRDGDFLAQIACTDLPSDLWEGLGPRSGSLAFFANPDTGAVLALHLVEDGVPHDPPHPPGPAYFRPWGLASATLAPLAVRAFPEWPVDAVTAEASVATAGTDRAAIEALFAADYDIGDPAFHPFDWPTMLAMADILESHVMAAPTDGAAPPDANDELAEAIADAAASNREAQAKLAEIIAIIHESATPGASFAPSDATAVMAALHAIRWTGVTATSNPESGEDQVETLTLPLTRRRPDSDLWVDDFRLVLFDHAKHAWSANPDRLSAPARAFFEPVWQAMAADETALVGGFPSRHAPGFNDEFDVVILELPASALLGLAHRDGGHLVLAMRKADLASGDFTKLRAIACN